MIPAVVMWALGMPFIGVLYRRAAVDGVLDYQPVAMLIAMLVWPIISVGMLVAFLLGMLGVSIHRENP